MRVLATLEDVYTELGVSPVDPTNAKALAKLEEASDVVRRYTGQLFDFIEDDVVYLHGSGTRSLQLPQCPVYEVSLVENLDETGTVVTNPSTFRFRVDASAGLMYRQDDDWTVGNMNWRVTYTHGYLVPGQTYTGLLTVEELPPSVRKAVTEIAAQLVVLDPAGIVDSERIGNYNVNYASPPGESPRRFGEQLGSLQNFRVIDAA
jgi:hypothetical protein